MRERLASLISGGGTTMEQIVKACQSGEVPMEVACVISSTPDAGGIEKARKLGIPDRDIVVVNPREFRTKDGKLDQDKFGGKLSQVLNEHKATVVTQNGWLPKTPAEVVYQYPGKIFNQHPGSVPEFGGPGMYGRRVHAAVLVFRRLTESDYWTEAIAQRVHPENYDQGAVVKSTTVYILPDDTVDDIQQRTLPLEHRVQIELLKDVAKGRVTEIRRDEPLIKPGDELILKLAKKIGRFLYPHG